MVVITALKYIRRGPYPAYQTLPVNKNNTPSQSKHVAKTVYCQHCQHHTNNLLPEAFMMQLEGGCPVEHLLGIEGTL